MIILKIILFILLAVLGIILLILLLPASAEISFIGEKLEYRLKYAFIRIMDSQGGGLLGYLNGRDGGENRSKSGDMPEKQEKAPETGKHDPAEKESKYDKVGKKLRNAEEKQPETLSDAQESGTAPEKKSSAAEQDKANKKTPGEMVGLLMDIWSSAKRPLRRLLRGFHITDIYIDFLVADEDAYNCAMKYARICTSVYNGLAQFGNLFTVRYKTVDVDCGFGQEKSRWDAGCKVYFLPVTAVITGIWFLITYIFRIYLPGKRKSKKSAEKQSAQPQGGM